MASAHRSPSGATSQHVHLPKARKIHPDGIRFEGLRYTDPVLAAYVGEPIIIRYDPRDLAEIRVYRHDGAFVCRAICPELAGTTIGLKEITAARNARRRELRQALGDRASVVDRLIEVHRPPSATPRPAGPESQALGGGRRLKRYHEE